MDYQVTYSNNFEANRILQTLVQTSNGFYYRKNFAVLPYLIERNPACVYLPNLNYKDIENGFQNWSKIPNRPPTDYSKEWVDDITSLNFKYNQALLEKAKDTAEKVFNNNFQKAWNYLALVIPEIQSQINFIEIRITQYGTGSSFRETIHQNKPTLTCFLRTDMNPDRIYTCIVQSFLENNNELYIEKNWLGKQSIADFLLSQLNIKQITSPFETTLKALFELDPKLIEESHHYQQSIGIEFVKPLLVKDGIIYYKGKSISQDLSGTQNAILLYMLTNDSRCITFNELGNLMWDNEDNFSIWAINKAIARIKEKIDILQLPIKIENKKGEGYYINI